MITWSESETLNTPMVQMPLLSFKPQVKSMFQVHDGILDPMRDPPVQTHLAKSWTLQYCKVLGSRSPCKVCYYARQIHSKSPKSHLET